MEGELRGEVLVGRNAPTPGPHGPGREGAALLQLEELAHGGVFGEPLLDAPPQLRELLDLLGRELGDAPDDDVACRKITGEHPQHHRVSHGSPVDGLLNVLPLFRGEHLERLEHVFRADLNPFRPGTPCGVELFGGLVPQGVEPRGLGRREMRLMQ